MITGLEQPLGDNPGVSYVSQYVPLPFDMYKKQLADKQAVYDMGANAMDIGDPHDALRQEEDIVRNVYNTHRNNVSAILEKYKDNPDPIAAAAPELAANKKAYQDWYDSKGINYDRNKADYNKKLYDYAKQEGTDRFLSNLYSTQYVPHKFVNEMGGSENNVLINEVMPSMIPKEVNYDDLRKSVDQVLLRPKEIGINAETPIHMDKNGIFYTTTTTGKTEKILDQEDVKKKTIEYLKNHPEVSRYASNITAMFGNNPNYVVGKDAEGNDITLGKYLDDKLEKEILNYGQGVGTVSEIHDINTSTTRTYKDMPGYDPNNPDKKGLDSESLVNLNLSLAEEKKPGLDEHYKTRSSANERAVTDAIGGLLSQEGGSEAWDKFKKSTGANLDELSKRAYENNIDLSFISNPATRDAVKNSLTANYRKVMDAENHIRFANSTAGNKAGYTFVGTLDKDGNRTTVWLPKMKSDGTLIYNSNSPGSRAATSVNGDRKMANALDWKQAALSYEQLKHSVEGKDESLYDYYEKMQNKADAEVAKYTGSLQSNSRTLDSFYAAVRNNLPSQVANLGKEADKAYQDNGTGTGQKMGWNAPKSSAFASWTGKNGKKVNMEQVLDPNAVKAQVFKSADGKNLSISDLTTKSGFKDDSETVEHIRKHALIDIDEKDGMMKAIVPMNLDGTTKYVSFPFNFTNTGKEGIVVNGDLQPDMKREDNIVVKARVNSLITSASKYGLQGYPLSRSSKVYSANGKTYLALYDDKQYNKEILNIDIDPSSTRGANILKHIANLQDKGDTKKLSSKYLLEYIKTH